ncbi:dnaJ homolog dnj-5-like [Artemia franciscana]|uniref:J domain-containing protein n=1 Tax=Artemia franciscana TaxID=6661 RepID=A0AA88HNR2_ARTSF|nr:hypothetical protein QYM36_011857 [Artemia franciscana]
MTLVYTVYFLLEVGPMASEGSKDQSEECGSNNYWGNQEGIRLSPAQFLFQSPCVFPTDIITSSQQRGPLSNSIYPQFYSSPLTSGSWKDQKSVNNDYSYRGGASVFSSNPSQSPIGLFQQGAAASSVGCDKTYDLFNGGRWDLHNLGVHTENPFSLPPHLAVNSTSIEKENEEPTPYPPTPEKTVGCKPSYKDILSKSASLNKIGHISPTSFAVQYETVKPGSTTIPKAPEQSKHRISQRNSLPSTPTHSLTRSTDKRSLQDVDDEFVILKDNFVTSNGLPANVDSGKKKFKHFDVTSGDLAAGLRTKTHSKDKKQYNGTLANQEVITDKKATNANKRQKEHKSVVEEFSDGSSSKSEVVNLPKKQRQKDFSRKRDENEKSSIKVSSKFGSKRRREVDSSENQLAKLAKELSLKWLSTLAVLALWLVRLVIDVASLGIVVSKEGVSNFTDWFSNIGRSVTTVIIAALKKGLQRVYDLYVIRILNLFPRRNNATKKNAISSSISLPSTGEEAMRRLLACRGKDPYSILGVSRDCSDEEIKRYYRKQAILVHPDKNRQAGAEEAFKILAHAFELIGEPIRRQRYDQAEREKRLVQSTDGELSDLLDALQRKMDEAINTIKCTNCNQRHRRNKTGRPLYAGRYCRECNIYHQAKDGELWAESRWMGLKWIYLACMENTIFEITEWGNCQSGSLRHLKPNVHAVQYKLKPWNASNGTPNQEQRKNTCQDPTDLSDDEWENLLAGMYKNCSFGHGSSCERANGQKNKKAKRKAK